MKIQIVDHGIEGSNKLNTDSVRDAWRDKASRIIFELCSESYRQANYLKNGRKRKRHVQYSVPIKAQMLLDALNKNDEHAAKALFLEFAMVPQSMREY